MTKPQLMATVFASIAKRSRTLDRRVAFGSSRRRIARASKRRYDRQPVVLQLTRKPTVTGAWLITQQIVQCALLVTALTLWTPAHAQAPKDVAIPVGVAKAVARPPDTRIKLSGTVLPWATSSLAAEVEGKVEKLLFGEGQYVKKGTLLVQLDTYPLELERSLALAELKLVAIQLEELQAGSRIETLEAAQATADKARAHFKMKEVELNRIKQLYEDGITSVHDYDNAKAAAEEAQAQYDKEKAFLKEVAAGPRIEKIKQE
ncbi:MAG: biotin/lipoyl-binding protein, partial [Nitrospinales bacterium]